MTFEDYIELVKESAMEDGYNAYHPSLCILDPEPRIAVLESEISDEGEEDIAKDWARTLLDDTDAAYLSYRTTDRTIHIDKIENGEVTEEVLMKVEASN